MECLGKLIGKLPPHWNPMMEDGGIHLLKYSPGRAKVVQRSIFLSSDRKLQAFFHGKELSPDHLFYKDVSKISLNACGGDQLAAALCKVVGEYRLYEVCCGVPARKFKSLWHKEENCVVDINAFQESRYTETCRSKSCHLAVPQLRRLCEECHKVHKKFSGRAVFRKPHAVTPSKQRQQTPNKFKPNACLNTPERNARLRRYRKVIINQRKVNERLRTKIEKILEDESIQVDKDLDDDLTEALQDADKENKLTDFHKLFLQQQLKASQVKSATAMRWHPLMIRFALQLKMLSSTTYTTMAKSGFLRLPSDRTLFDYSHAMATQEGCHTEIIQDVAKVVESLDDYQKYHSLMFDEVTISQGLVQRKTTGEVVGYCKLNSVQEEILKIEKRVKDMAEQVPSQELSKLPMVKKVLSFMIKGTASGVENVVASYGVSLLTKEDLHEHTWEVIENLEVNGIRVCAVVCDGSPINRGFIDMQPPSEETESGIVFDTVNIFAPERNIFFISDPPHLLKTIRNCLYNSGKTKSRKMKENGEFLTWHTIVRLYKYESGLTIKKLFKLTAACVFLNSYSRMKVAYAARVFSKSVAAVLKTMKWNDSKELSLFGESQ